MLKKTSTPVPEEENLNSEEKARRQPRTGTQYLQSITVTTNAVGALTEINAINPRRTTERFKLIEHSPKTLEALTSEEGTLLRMNRSIQVEGVFGVLKEDYGFRRFLTRGKNSFLNIFLLSARLLLLSNLDLNLTITNISDNC